MAIQSQSATNTTGQVGQQKPAEQQTVNQVTLTPEQIAEQKAAEQKAKEDAELAELKANDPTFPTFRSGLKIAINTIGVKLTKKGDPTQKSYCMKVNLTQAFEDGILEDEHDKDTYIQKFAVAYQELVEEAAKHNLDLDWGSIETKSHAVKGEDDAPNTFRVAYYMPLWFIVKGGTTQGKQSNSITRPMLLRKG